jgi:hypothetical protein
MERAEITLAVARSATASGHDVSPVDNFVLSDLSALV